MAMACATHGCPGQASRHCERPYGEQLCGNCCDCVGHGRRSQRGGPRSGRRADASAEERETMQREYRVLSEACAWLQSCCSEELQQMAFTTPTMMRKVLCRTAQATLLQMQHEQVPQLPDTAWQLIEMLPYHLYVRLLQRISVDMGATVPQVIYTREPSETSAASSSMAVTQQQPGPQMAGSSTSIRERTPRQTGRQIWIPKQQSVVNMPSPESELRAQNDVDLLQLDDITPAVVDMAKLALTTFNIPDEVPTINANMAPRPEGYMLWDPIADHARSPVCRSEGSFPVMRIQRGDRTALTAWLQGGGHLGGTPTTARATAAGMILRAWLNAREHLAEKLDSFHAAIPPWQDVGHGKWFVAAMKGVHGDTTNTAVGYHGTSMHMLHRIVARGMENSISGVFVRGEKRFGVYHHVRERAHLCANYMMYSALERKSGYTYAPLVQIQYPHPDPHHRLNVVRRSNAHQNLTYADVCTVTHVWLHVTHVLEFYTGARNLIIMAEPFFAKHLELHPDDSWEAIMERSRRLGARAD